MNELICPPEMLRVPSRVDSSMLYSLVDSKVPYPTIQYKLHFVERDVSIHYNSSVTINDNPFFRECRVRAVVGAPHAKDVKLQEVDQLCSMKATACVFILSACQS